MTCPSDPIMWGPGYELKGRWTLEKQIAHGSYSTVWRAKDSRTDQPVAVKNLRVSAQLESAKRALREVEMLKHFIGSNNILQILDIVVIPGISTDVEEICIVSELMDFDLHALIQSELSLDENAIRFIMFQILTGVRIMHAAHTLHRDLKPKNVLLNDQWETKICDLGMGRSKVESGSMLKMTLISRVATASYRAPDGILNIRTTTDTNANECAATSDHDNLSKDDAVHYTTAVDVWACGCILAELLTRSPLFPFKDNSALLSAFVNTLGPPSSAVLSRIPTSHASKQLNEAIKQYEQTNPPLVPRLSSLISSEYTEALDLCQRMLTFDPNERITIADALNHPWFTILGQDPPPQIQPFVDPTDDVTLDLARCNQLIISSANSLANTPF